MFLQVVCLCGLRRLTSTVAHYEKEAACTVKKHDCCRGESGGKKDLYVKNDMMKEIYVS